MCKTGLNQSGTSLNQLKRQDKRSLPGKQHQTVTRNSIKRIYRKDWSCDRAIFILHNSLVGYITEKLYFSSMNGTVQCVPYKEQHAVLSLCITCLLGLSLANLGIPYFVGSLTLWKTQLQMDPNTPSSYVS